MTCKATAQSISDILQSCIQLISLQEDTFAKCLEQETSKRLLLEETCRQQVVQLEETNCETEKEVSLFQNDIVKWKFYDWILFKGKKFVKLSELYSCRTTNYFVLIFDYFFHFILFNTHSKFLIIFRKFWVGRWNIFCMLILHAK